MQNKGIKLANGILKYIIKENANQVEYLLNSPEPSLKDLDISLIESFTKIIEVYKSSYTIINQSENTLLAEEVKMKKELLRNLELENQHLKKNKNVSTSPDENNNLKGLSMVFSKTEMKGLKEKYKLQSEDMIYNNEMLKLTETKIKKQVITICNLDNSVKVLRNQIEQTHGKALLEKLEKAGDRVEYLNNELSAMEEEIKNIEKLIQQEEEVYQTRILKQKESINCLSNAINEIKEQIQDKQNSVDNKEQCSIKCEHLEHSGSKEKLIQNNPQVQELNITKKRKNRKRKNHSHSFISDNSRKPFNNFTFEIIE